MPGRGCDCGNRHASALSKAFVALRYKQPNLAPEACSVGNSLRYTISGLRLDVRDHEPLLKGLLFPNLSSLSSQATQCEASNI